jgi:hypothetical protein
LIFFKLSFPHENMLLGVINYFQWSVNISIWKSIKTIDPRGLVRWHKTKDQSISSFWNGKK